MSDKDWEEDFEHENGNYSRQCSSCHEMFIGHKRRVTCRCCAVVQCKACSEAGGADRAIYHLTPECKAGKP